jgi:hypothetical protein
LGRKPKARAGTKAKAKARLRRPGARRDESASFVGYWAVAYLDLMGYRGLLRAADVYPLPTERAEQEVLTRKAVRPFHFRRRFVDGIKAFQDGAREGPPDPRLAALPASFQELARQWRAVRIKTYAVGDFVAMEMALTPDLRHFPARALDTILTAICASSLMQLWAGGNDLNDTLPIRGGVDVGVGAVFERELYSAALAKAVELEEQASVPRVLAGEHLLGYIDSMARADGADLTTGHMRELAMGIRGFLAEDPDDRKIFVDFLGERFRNRAAVPTGQVEAAWRFVQKALAAFADNPKLLPKYQWLDRYFRSRLHLWGVTP